MPTSIIRPTSSPRLGIAWALLVLATTTPLVWYVNHTCPDSHTQSLRVTYDSRVDTMIDDLDELSDDVNTITSAVRSVARDVRRLEGAMQAQSASQGVASVSRLHVVPEDRSDPTEDATVGRIERGIGSWMCHEDDRWCGSSSACPLPALDGSGRTEYRRVVESDHVVAHRTAPCGARLRICNPDTGACTIAVKGTTGPFGATLEPGERPLSGRPWNATTRWSVKIRPGDPGRWRGIVDMTTSVRDAIGHDGWGPVTVEHLDEPVSRAAQARTDLIEQAYGILALSGWTRR